jgi:hypothetical protein
VKHDIGWAHVEVPDDWEDRRTVQFVSPPLVVADPRLAARGGTGTGGRRSFVATIGDRGGTPVDEIATQQLAALQDAIPGLVVVGRPTFAHPALGPCPALDILVHAGTDAATRQLLVFVPGERVVATLAYSTRPNDKSADEDARAFVAAFAWQRRGDGS